MALIRWHKPALNVWSPVRHLSTLRDEIDRLFESPLNALTSQSQQLLSGWLPPVDLHEERDHLIFQAELPGMKKEDINISLHGDVLSLSGERRQEQQVEGAEVCRTERFLGRFQRTLTLPMPVDAKGIQATYRDGILTVTLPKAEQAKPKQIEVKIS